jgi:ferritin-like protein
MRRGKYLCHIFAADREPLCFQVKALSNDTDGPDGPADERSIAMVTQASNATKPALRLVSRELVEKAGIDVDELLKLLVANASAELTTFYYYTILRVNLVGFQGEGLKEIAEDARIEDRNHFEALLPRIYELGGRLPDDMNAFHDLSACPPARLPSGNGDIRAIAEVLLRAEQCAVRGYTHVCNLTMGKDHRTYDLALAILHEEIEHEAWFAEFLEMGSSGHFRRRRVGESPFVSKFLHVE